MTPRLMRPASRSWTRNLSTLAVGMVAIAPGAIAVDHARLRQAAQPPATVSVLSMQDMLADGLDKLGIAKSLTGRISLHEGTLLIPPSSAWVTLPVSRADFQLDLDLRFERGAEAGIVVRGFFAPDGEPRDPRRGLEIWIPHPADGNASLVVRHVGKRREVPFEAGLWPRIARPDGEWHSVRVLGTGEMIRVLIDGTQVLVGNGAFAGAGGIAFRARGGPVEWRRVLLSKPPERPRPPDVTLPEDEGVQKPTIQRSVKPGYSRKAMDRQVEGSVWIECVVLEDGGVGDVHVVAPLDPDLDAEAIKAVRKWRFRPATRDGRPVKMQVMIEMTFRLDSP